jgi:hypothetical protein
MRKYLAAVYFLGSIVSLSTALTAAEPPAVKEGE